MCGRCTILEARLTSLEDELRAWREYREDAPPPAFTFDPEAVANAYRVFGLNRSEARLLLALLSRNGRLVATDEALDIYADKIGLRDYSNLVAVYICRIRRALEAAGFDGAVETIRSQGYSIKAQIAEQITALIEQGGERIAA